MTAIFVTGTGTDVGKTFVTVGLIGHLRAAGRAADAIKPIVSGFNAGDPAASDPAILLEALGRPGIRGTPFIPAIMVSAWYGGVGPGLFAVGLSLLALEFFILVPRQEDRLARVRAERRDHVAEVGLDAGNSAGAQQHVEDENLAHRS